MDSTAMPNPSGFRTIRLKPEAPVRLFAARLVHEKIDFNYSFDGKHRFVYPVKHYAQMVHLMNEVFHARQKRKTPRQAAHAKAEMARTIRNAYRDSGI